MQEIEIKIAKWEKYQLRKDIKRPWWFAISNELWCSAEFSLFTAEEKLVWYALLAIASKQQSAQVKFDLTWLAQNSSIEKDSVLSAIEKAKDNKWLTVIRTESVQNPYAIRTSHNITKQDITKQNKLITKDTDSMSQVSIKKVPKIDNSRVIATYCSSYKARYQARPEIDGKTIGLINGLLKTHSPEKICDLLQVYLQMNDPWFIKKAHDFSTFRENLTKVSAAMQTGTDLGAPVKKKTWQELVDEEEAQKNGAV